MAIGTEDHHPRRRASVLDTEISFVDAGEGAPIVFLHGNPTSSYLWRNIIPHTVALGRCLAPDLVGMGRSGKSPGNRYRFDQRRRLPGSQIQYREVTMSLRAVKKLITAKPTLEGAGVHLRRAFGFGQTSDYDPFLLLDDFRNDVPADYLAGFPWHPHRGIETITYVLAGTVEHADSLGNRGAIATGDIQWMTAGSGIVHQEMPKGDQTGRMHGFQLWANLPAALKMTKPRYQEVKSPDIPEITDDDGTQVRLVCGHFWGKTGPVEGIAADPTYIDVSVPPGKRKALPVETSRHAFAYVFGGSGTFCNASQPLAVPTESVGWWPHATPPAEVDDRTLVLFDRGDEVVVQGGENGIRFLLVSGQPLQEPVAWYGPIVMNTQAELRQAFDELEQGTFLKQDQRNA